MSVLMYVDCMTCTSVFVLSKNKRRKKLKIMSTVLAKLG